MKVAVYGDSFAHLIAPNLCINHDGARWVDLVKDAGFDLTNYSFSSSSFYFSYMNFKTHCNEYDKNIFLGTFPGRRYIKNPTGKTAHAHVYHTRPEFKNHLEFGGNLHQALNLYYEYLYNDEEDKTYLNLMEKDILTHDNLLYLNIEKTLRLIYHRDKTYFNVNPSTEEKNENMHCHLTNESNKVLAEEVIQWLQTGKFEFNLDKYPLPDITTRRKYWLSN